MLGIRLPQSIEKRSSASEIAKEVIVSALQMDDLIHLDAISFSIHCSNKGLLQIC
jgi:hypothetical protein